MAKSPAGERLARLRLLRPPAREGGEGEAIFWVLVFSLRERWDSRGARRDGLFFILINSILEEEDVFI
jgi:hypothetical protein